MKLETNKSEFHLEISFQEHIYISLRNIPCTIHYQIFLKVLKRYYLITNLLMYFKDTVVNTF